MRGAEAKCAPQWGAPINVGGTTLGQSPLRSKSRLPTLPFDNLSEQIFSSPAGLESQCTQQQRLQLQASQSALQSALQQQVVVMINPFSSHPLPITIPCFHLVPLLYKPDSPSLKMPFPPSFLWLTSFDSSCAFVLSSPFLHNKLELISIISLSLVSF